MELTQVMTEAMTWDNKTIIYHWMQVLLLCNKTPFMMEVVVTA